MKHILLILLLIQTTTNVLLAEDKSFEIYLNKSIKTNNYNLAIKYLDTSKVFITNYKDSIQLYNGYGRAYYYKTDYYTAINYFDSSMYLIEKYHYNNFKPYILNNLASAYTDLYKFEIAIDLLQQSYKIIETKYKGTILNNIARCYKYLNKLDSSSYYFKESFNYKLKNNGLYNYSTLLTAIEIIENTGDKKLIEKIKKPILEQKNNYLLGRFLLYTGDYKKAEELFTGDFIHLLRVYRDSKQYLKAVSIIDSLRNSYLDIESKLFLQCNKRIIYKNAIDQALQTDTLFALKLAVKSRSNLLREELGALDYKIPESYNYFDFDSIIYLFQVTGNIKLYKIHTDSIFRNNYKTFIHCLQIDSVKNNYYQSYRQYCESALYLYRKLVPSQNKKMTVIPDGRIHYIPFEALLTEMPDTTEPNFKVLPYLMLQADIHYDYLLKEHSISKKKIKITCLVPDMGLLFSKKLAKKLQKYRGRVLKGKEATSQYIQEGNILHIEAHYSPADKYIILPDTLLYIQQISDLPKELTIIATCFSGTGKNYAGEGIFSPGRSFYQAGSKSVLESIWESDGESSYMLLTEFYKNLNANNSKSTALTRSKLEYLDKCLHSRSHPFYWAHMRVFGNDCPLNIEVKNRLFILIGAISIIVFLQYLFRLLRK